MLVAHISEASALLGYLEGCTISEGPLQGQPFEVLPWERQFIEGAFQPDVFTAGLSIPRAGGKTTLCAGIGGAFVTGPLRAERSSVLIVSGSFQQARFALGHILVFTKLNNLTRELRKVWRVWNSANSAVIEHRESGATLRCLGSDPRRLHGHAASLVIGDEPSQWGIQGEAMLSALMTGLGKQTTAKLLLLGTRPHDESHFFERALQGGFDYAQVHCAPADSDPLDPAVWHLANPSLAYFPRLLALYQSEAKQAAQDAAAMASFRALRLNQGVADTVEKILISADSWAAIEVDILPMRSGAPILGVDLGASASASGFAAYWPTSGRLEGHMSFGSDPDLATRARKDHAGATYLKMQAEGGIRLHPGMVPDVGGMLAESFELYGVPSCIVCDRWRLSETFDALKKIGATRIPILTRGQGFKDGAEDVRGFRAAVLSKKVFVQRSLTWRVTMAGSRTETDAAGNAKLSKKSQRARDDLAAASIIAIAEGYRQLSKPVPKMRIAWA